MNNVSISNKTLHLLDNKVIRPKYNREDVEVGIVHIGPGAFHRAHQAVYADDLLNAGHLKWGICEVSINSSTVKDALSVQDYLYTLAILDNTINYRIIGAIKEMLVAPENPQQVIERLATSNIKVISLTITEKGYCLDENGNLNFEHEGIKQDSFALKNQAIPKTALGYLAAGLKKRFETSAAPVCILSCDNLSNNGIKLKQAIIKLCSDIGSDFLVWLEEYTIFPCTMVDSITPATDDALREQVQAATHAQDLWPIQREAFCQWVIEHLPCNFENQLPNWQSVGVIESDNIHDYELAKLRILNGTHTALAMLGLQQGIKTVAQAVNHPYLRNAIEHMLKNEIIPTLPSSSGINYSIYSSDILKRYQNPSIKHLLSQIAWDSSQKLPIRLLGTIKDALDKQIAPTYLCLTIAAWACFIVHKVREDEKIIDPLEDSLRKIAANCNGEKKDIEQFFTLKSVFNQGPAINTTLLPLIQDAYQHLNSALSRGNTQAIS